MNRSRMLREATESEKRILPLFLLWLFLGPLGVHAFYAGRVVQGLIYLVLALLVFFLVAGASLAVPGHRPGMVFFLLGAAGLQGICLLVDLIWILVGAYKDGDGHRITKWIEPAGSIVIRERPEVGPEQRCPRCHGDLYAQPEVCMHCRTELRWIGGWPYTVADAVALQQRQALAEAEARKAEIQARLAAAQEKAAIQEKLAAVLGDSPGTCLRRQWEKPPSRSFLRTVAAPFRRFDDWLCQSLGDDNRVLYRGVQIILYGVLPLAVLACVLASIL